MAKTLQNRLQNVWMGGAGRRNFLDVPGEFISPELERQVTSRAKILSRITVEDFLWI